MSESPEVQMARQDERIKGISKTQEEFRQGMKEMTEQFGQMFSALSNMENRLKVLEEKMEPSAEMMDEYNTLKHEVAGARRIMKVIWSIAAGLFALVITLRHDIAKLFE